MSEILISKTLLKLIGSGGKVLINKYKTLSYMYLCLAALATANPYF